MVFGIAGLFTRPVEARRNGAQTPAPKLDHAKPVVISLDIDGTVIPWHKGTDRFDQTAYLRYQHTLHDPALRKNSFVVLNTGRGLKATQSLASMLSHLPIDAVGVNDGQQLFIRPALQKGQHPVAVNQRWLQSLTSKQQDAHWKKELNGWSTKKVLKDVVKLMPQLEFKQIAKPGQTNPYNQSTGSYIFIKPIALGGDPRRGFWAVRLNPDQTWIEVKVLNRKFTPERNAKYADVLGRMFKDRLQNKWPGFSYSVTTHSNKTYLHLAPKGISKASLVHYMANRRFEQKPKAIISAGDNQNDRPLLSLNHLENISNYPILVGERPEMIQSFARKRPERLEMVGWNQLHQGIEDQYQKIGPLLEAPPASVKPDPWSGIRAVARIFNKIS